MSVVVQKYGGTSVGDIEKIKNVAKRVVATKKKGNNVVVVVSAMAGQTDKLIALATQLCCHPSAREMDMLMSSGERISSALLCIAIHELGFDAISLTGRQVGIITDDSHTKARIKKVTASSVNNAFKNDKIVVAAGFQGISCEDDDVTTLGRGGSDTTAVAIAAALKAKVCEIYTDVDGVYTADPNIVSKAKRIKVISFDEMLEMASLGAKVLQSRSVEMAKKYQIPIKVRSAFTDSEGTLVTKEDKEMEKEIVSGVTCDKNQAKITLTGIPDKPGIAADIFAMVSEKKYLVDMIIQNISDAGLTDLSFTVPKKDANIVFSSINTLKNEIGAHKVSLDENISKVSIVGVGMKSHSGVAAKMFLVLAQENINIMMISTSEIKISCVIEEKYTELAIRALHKKFDLDAD